MSCADTRTALGAYVLGALDLDEHQQVRAHLADCAQCRAEYDQLAGVPSLLATVTPEQAEQVAADLAGDRPVPQAIAPSDTGLHRLLGQVRQERTRSRRSWRLVLAGAAAAVLLAIGGGVLAGGQWFSEDIPGGSPTGPTLTWSGENEATDVEASAELTEYGWGVRLTMVMNGIEPGQICDFRIYDTYGREWGAGSWEVTEGHAKDIEWFGDVGVPLDHIARVELWEGGSNQRLLTWKL